MNNLFESLSHDPALLIPILAVGGGIIVVLALIVFNSIAATVRYRAREQSRREIAAYVAEGSITADEGERLLAAAGGSGKGGCGSC